MNLERSLVLDTNIIISAVLIKEGKARQALDKAQTAGIVLLSKSVLLELEEVLARPKFNKYVSAVERKLFLASFVKTAKFVEVEERIEVCRDPKDDKYFDSVHCHSTKLAEWLSLSETLQSHKILERKSIQVQQSRQNLQTGFRLKEVSLNE